MKQKTYLDLGGLVSYFRWVLYKRRFLNVLDTPSKQKKNCTLNGDDLGCSEVDDETSSSRGLHEINEESSLTAVEVEMVRNILWEVDKFFNDLYSKQ